MFPADGQWREVLGHGCSTLSEAREYCATLGSGMTVVQDGEELPPCPPPPPRRTLSPNANPEMVKMVLEALRLPE